MATPPVTHQVIFGSLTSEGQRDAPKGEVDEHDWVATSHGKYNQLITNNNWLINGNNWLINDNHK